MWVFSRYHVKIEFYNLEKELNKLKSTYDSGLAGKIRIDRKK
jgi:hypothetical protein